MKNEKQKKEGIKKDGRVKNIAKMESQRASKYGGIHT